MMIKPTVYGAYDVSLDGGKTFTYSTRNLILNTYYAKTGFTVDMTLSIGAGTIAPQLTDTALGSLFGTSPIEAGFESSPERVVFGDRFEITYSRLFDLGVGFTGILSELGINNPNLVSRALLKAADQTPTTVQLLVTDHVVVRYRLAYSISRTPQVFNLTINETPVVATVYAVNGEVGGWGTVNIAEVVRYANFGVASAGTWTLDANDNILGANIVNPVIASTNVNGILDLTIVGTVVAGVGDWNQSFQQILVTSAGVNRITAPILIDLDVPITKTSNDVINISVTANQAA